MKLSKPIPILNNGLSVVVRIMEKRMLRYWLATLLNELQDKVIDIKTIPLKMPREMFVMTVFNG